MTKAEISYFFIGVGKCGTSWIYEFLRRRNIVATPSIKEPYLVDVSAQKRSSLIAKLYTPQEGQPLADFSNVYYWDPDNAAKIKAINPHAKIVITTRLPSNRILSHFGFLQRNGILENGVSIETYIDSGDAEQIVERSDYAKIIARYEDVFGAENILVLPIELLKNAPQVYSDTLLAFMSQPTVELTDEDKLPVLKAAKARSRTLARLAKAGANGLRRMGLLTLLGRLKRQKFVRKALYSNTVEKIEPNFGSAKNRVAELDAQYAPLLQKHGYAGLEFHGNS